MLSELLKDWFRNQLCIDRFGRTIICSSEEGTVSAILIDSENDFESAITLGYHAARADLVVVFPTEIYSSIIVLAAQYNLSLYPKSILLLSIPRSKFEDSRIIATEFTIDSALTENARDILIQKSLLRVSHPCDLLIFEPIVIKAIVSNGAIVSTVGIDSFGRLLLSCSNEAEEENLCLHCQMTRSALAEFLNVFSGDNVNITTLLSAADTAAEYVLRTIGFERSSGLHDDFFFFGIFSELSDSVLSQASSNLQSLKLEDTYLLLGQRCISALLLSLLR